MLSIVQYDFNLILITLSLHIRDFEIEMGLLEENRFENVEELPRSEIIFNHEQYKSLSSKIIALYEKYVSPTCQFQINLSSRVRYQV